MIAIAAVALFVLVVGFGNVGASANTGSGACTLTVTADVLNVREGPSTDNRIVGKLKHGEKTSAQQTVTTGFRKLADHRWASEQFLKPTGKC